MISVAEAQALCLAQVTPTGTQTISLADGANRVLAAPVRARRDQPPFAASAMDGYAIGHADARAQAVLRVVGEAAAGHGWSGQLNPGEALRIFTGAPVPNGADRVILQEDVTRAGDHITLTTTPPDDLYIRPQGTDFASGFTLDAPRRLSPSDLGLIAAMNVAQITVARRPRIAILSTGDELIEPGGTPAPDQIIASNAIALAALISDLGATPLRLPIVADREDALDAALAAAEAQQADMIVTIGGASVGDHDLVAPALRRFGVDMEFHKVAMRPGKPLMAGAKGSVAVLGLPGNPVSSLVCGHVFLAPMLRHAMSQSDPLPPMVPARLTAPLRPGGPRAHYMRAQIEDGPEGRRVTPYPRQDSALMTVMATANALLLHPPHAPATAEGSIVDVLPI